MSAVLRPRQPLYIASALVAFMLVGFSRTYYLRFLSDLPPLTLILRIHGAVFTAWLGVFVVQAFLVSRRRVDLHRRLGIASAWFAVFVVVLGLLATIAASAVPRGGAGMTSGQFTIVGFTSIGLFAILVALGIAYRRQPALHRRYMILAMIAALSPAISRVLLLVDLIQYRDVFVPAVMGAFILWCLIADWRQHRVLHPIYAVGGIIVVASWPLRLMAGYSDWYRPLGEAVVSVAQQLTR